MGHRRRKREYHRSQPSGAGGQHGISFGEVTVGLAGWNHFFLKISPMPFTPFCRVSVAFVLTPPRTSLPILPTDAETALSVSVVSALSTLEVSSAGVIPSGPWPRLLR